MHVLIAPDKLKGSLSARDASAAIRRGVERAARESGIDLTIDECPIADGGEGTLEAIAAAMPDATRQVVPVHALSGPVSAFVLLAPSMLAISDADVQRAARPIRLGRAAFPGVVLALGALLGSTQAPQGSRAQTILIALAGVALVLGALFVLSAWAWLVWRRVRDPGTRPTMGMIESSSVIGLAHLPPSARNPEALASTPVGGLMLGAARAGAQCLVIGLGGSATVDGGIGMASALGWVFRDQNGRTLDADEPISAASLSRIASVKPPHNPPPSVVALCDVSSPLLGPLGAARVFGPQKGATPEQVERLEAGLANLVRVCRDAGLACEPDAPGAGAAGGLGFGLATFCGARLVSGAGAVLDLVRFDERCARADLVITAEGRVDAQTLAGKACFEAARRAARRGVPVRLLAGSIEGDAHDLLAELSRAGAPVAGLDLIAPPGTPGGESIARAAAFLEHTAHAVMQEWLGGNARG